MKYHDFCEWDPKKAKANEKKHGVSFEIAAAVLGDEQAEIFHYEAYDDPHSLEEDRHITFGSYPFERSIVLYVCWADRSSKGRKITRIISARHATPRERNLYAKAIKGK